MPDTYRALTGLTLADGSQLAPGDTTTKQLPAWVVEQGHAELVADAPLPQPEPADAVSEEDAR